MALVDEAQRAPVRPLPRICGHCHLAHDAVRPGGLHVGIGRLRHQFREVGATLHAAEQLLHPLRKTRADAQADQAPVGRIGAAAHRPGRGQGGGPYVADLVVAVDGDAQGHAVHELAGRHRRPRTESDFLPLFVAQRGLDFEAAVLQPKGAAGDLPGVDQFAFLVCAHVCSRLGSGRMGGDARSAASSARNGNSTQ